MRLSTPLLLLALLATLLAPGCGAPRALAGMTLLESAQANLTAERYESSAEQAEWLLEEDQDPPLTSADEAEAAFIAGEARNALGDHEKAFEHYKHLLETAPWSPHVNKLESRLYQIGLALLYEPQYDGWIFDSRGRGVEVMTTLQVHFRRSDLADDALRHVADYFASEPVQEWLEASLTYEQLFKEYPDSEWAERSLWLAAKMRLRRVYRAGYNHGDVYKAHELLQTSRRVHPRGAAAVEVKEDLAYTRDLIAESDLIVAAFYAARGHAYGEQLRLANAALLYPETAAGRLARDRLVAQGLDPDLMAGNPALTSIGTRVNRQSPWEQERK